jgi:transposase-like protein
MTAKMQAAYPIRIINKNNKKCPHCEEPMQWFEGLVEKGYCAIADGRYACSKCEISYKKQPSRATAKGMKMAKELKDNGEDMWSIMRFPVAVQIGILRIWQQKAKQIGGEK